MIHYPIIMIILSLSLFFDNQALERKTITFFITKRLVSSTWVESLKKMNNVAPELAAVTTLLKERMNEVPSEASSSSTEVDRCPFSCPRRTS